MPHQHRHRWLRHALGAVAVLAALVPVGAAASTPSPVNSGILDTVLAAAEAAGSQVATCVVETYINRMVVVTEFGDKVTCSSAVVHLHTTAQLVDDTIGNAAIAAPCDAPAPSCSNDGTLTPSLVVDHLTLTVTVAAILQPGWTWANPPSGCSVSGSEEDCTVTQESYGPISPGPVSI